MNLMNFFFVSRTKHFYIMVGLLLVGCILGLFIAQEKDSVWNLSVFNDNNKAQQGIDVLVSSKNTLVTDNFNGHQYELIQDSRTWSSAKIDR